MKTIIFLLALFLTSVIQIAKAAQVGDFAEYTYSYKNATNQADLPANLKLTITAIDQKTKEYKVISMTTMGNGKVEGERILQVMGDPKITIKDLCAQLGSPVTSITTAAGKIDTCYQEMISGTDELKMWMLADFPRLAKHVTIFKDTNGNLVETDMELIKLNRRKK